MSDPTPSRRKGWLRTDAKGGMITFLIEAAIVAVGAIFTVAVSIVVLQLV